MDNRAKLLHIDALFFLLPEDFKGGLSEALRAFADYHDSVSGTPKQKIFDRVDDDPEDSMTIKELRDKRFSTFLDAIHSEEEYRVHGGVSISVYNSETNELEDLHPNTGEPG